MNRKYVLSGAAVVGAVLIVGALIITTPQERTLPFVYIIYGGEKGDRSYTDSAYRGIFSAQDAMPFSKREFVTFDRKTLSKLMNRSNPERPGLVITIGYTYADETRSLAAENPDIRFLAIDQTSAGSSNLRTYEITSYGESYLAGVLAATATQTRHVGIILGTQSDLLNGFRQGYLDGARAAEPSIIIEEAYVRDNSTIGFSDPVRAGEIARAMYRNGTDVIYTVAGFSGTGAITEAKAAPGRYIIGVDSDQTDLGPSVILASAVKRLDRIVYTGIGDYLNQSFTGGEKVAGLQDGATGLVFNPKFNAYNETVSLWTGKAQEGESSYLATRKKTIVGK